MVLAAGQCAGDAVRQSRAMRIQVPHGHTHKGSFRVAAVTGASIAGASSASGGLWSRLSTVGAPQTRSREVARGTMDAYSAP